MKVLKRTWRMELSRVRLRAGNTGEQRVKFTPDKLWSDRMEEVEVVASAKEQTLTLYPKAIVCHYTWKSRM